MELKWNKTCALLKPTIQVKITKEDVLDIICSAVNGGVGYWGATSANDEDYSEAKKHLVEQGADLKDVCYEEVFAQILFDGKSLEITDIENDKKYFSFSRKTFHRNSEGNRGRLLFPLQLVCSRRRRVRRMAA